MPGDWFDGAGDGREVDAVALLDSVSWERLRQLIDLGAMLTFAKSSDGGALGVTITVDGRWRREYFRDGEALDTWTEEAMVPVSRACEVRRSSGEGAKRTRRTRGL